MIDTRVQPFAWAHVAFTGMGWLYLSPADQLPPCTHTMAGSAPHPAGRWRSRLSSRLSTSGIVLYGNVSIDGDVDGHGSEVIVLIVTAVLVMPAVVDAPVVVGARAMNVEASSGGFPSEHPMRPVPKAQIIDVITKQRAITGS